jgi:hypothetical protein
MNVLLASAATYILIRFIDLAPSNRIIFTAPEPKPVIKPKVPTWAREDRVQMYILCPNNIPMIDFFDIRTANRKVRIGLPANNLDGYKLLTKLISSYDLDDKVTIISLSDSEITGGYGIAYDIFFEMTMPRSENILALTEMLPSHLLYIKELNDGGVIIKEKFYKDNLEYCKSVFDINWLKKTYPYITMIGKTLGLYIPTVELCG